MTATRMSNQMEAHLRAIIGERMKVATLALQKAIIGAPANPISLPTQTTDFVITTHLDGTREFVLTVTLAETATPTNTPSAGFSKSPL